MNAQFALRLPRRFSAVLASLAVVALAVSAVGLQVLGSYDGVTFGGATLGGDTPLLLGYGGGTSPDERTIIFYAYQPHAELRIQLGVANRGDLPVTIRGLALDDEWQTWFESAEIRLPPTPTLDALPLYPAANGSSWYSEPFRPFVLSPHAATTLALVLHEQDCSVFDAEPMPTRRPGEAPAESFMPSAAYSPIATLPIAYSVAGVDRVTSIALPEQIAIARPGMSAGCPSPEYRRDLENGIAPSPVRS